MTRVAKKLVKFDDDFYRGDHPALSDHGLRWWWCGGRVLSVCVLVLAFSFLVVFVVVAFGALPCRFVFLVVFCGGVWRVALSVCLLAVRSLFLFVCVEKN